MDLDASRPGGYAGGRRVERRVRRHFGGKLMSGPWRALQAQGTAQDQLWTMLRQECCPRLRVLQQGVGASDQQDDEDGVHQPAEGTRRDEAKEAIGSSVEDMCAAGAANADVQILQRTKPHVVGHSAIQPSPISREQGAAPRAFLVVHG
jgi:hypothetical protein